MFSQKIHKSLDIWIKIGWFSPIPMIEGSQHIKLKGPTYKLYSTLRVIYAKSFFIFSVIAFSVSILSIYKN